MPYFALTYQTVDNFAERRTPYRPDHIKRVRDAHARGELIMAGAIGDPPTGALLIFRAPDRLAAQNFAKKDPYVVQGLVKAWTVQPWTVVVGNDPAEPTPSGLPT
jgi:uncharacterized protein YciI